jgi:hypothetical protein
MYTELRERHKEIYMDSFHALNKPRNTGVGIQESRPTIHKEITGGTEQFFGWHQQQHVGNTTSAVPMNKSNSSPKTYQTDETQQKIEKRRERSRRLAREFRARRKEEILYYRSTIASLTQKVRELVIENKELRYMLEQLGGCLRQPSSGLLDSDPREDIVSPMEKQEVVQVLLSNVSPCTSGGQQISSNFVSVERAAEQGKVPWTLPPLFQSPPSTFQQPTTLLHRQSVNLV